MFSGELASRSHLSGDMRKWQRVIPPLEMTAALPPPSPPPLSFPSPFLAATSNAALWLLLNSQGGNIQGGGIRVPFETWPSYCCLCLSLSGTSARLLMSDGGRVWGGSAGHSAHRRCLDSDPDPERRRQSLGRRELAWLPHFLSFKKLQQVNHVEKIGQLF